MAAAVPGVEVADHRDAPRVRRPDGEMHAVGALVVERVRAHLVEEAEVAALADVVVVHRPEHGAEGIGVGRPTIRRRRCGARYLSGWRLRMRERALEEAGVVAALERARGLAVEGEGLELGGAVDEGAGDELAARRPARRARRTGRRARRRRSPRSPRDRAAARRGLACA